MISLDEYEKLIDGMTVLEMDENAYFEQAITTEKRDTLCKGWDFMRTNITPKLKALVMDRKNLEKLCYNRAIADYLKPNLAVKPEWEKSLDTFVYLIQEKIKKSHMIEKENELSSGGFKRLNSQDIAWAGRSVEFIVRGEGAFGSYERRGKGKVVWSDQMKSLFILPSKCRTKGYSADHREIWVR